MANRMGAPLATAAPLGSDKAQGAETATHLLQLGKWNHTEKLEGGMRYDKEETSPPNWHKREGKASSLLLPQLSWWLFVPNISIIWHPCTFRCGCSHWPRALRSSALPLSPQEQHLLKPHFSLTGAMQLSPGPPPEATRDAQEKACSHMYSSYITSGSIPTPLAHYHLIVHSPKTLVRNSTWFSMREGPQSST